MPVRAVLCCTRTEGRQGAPRWGPGASTSQPCPPLTLAEYPALLPSPPAPPAGLLCALSPRVYRRLCQPVGGRPGGAAARAAAGRPLRPAPQHRPPRRHCALKPEQPAAAPAACGPSRRPCPPARVAAAAWRRARLACLRTHSPTDSLACHVDPSREAPERAPTQERETASLAPIRLPPQPPCGPARRHPARPAGSRALPLATHRPRLIRTHAPSLPPLHGAAPSSGLSLQDPSVWCHLYLLLHPPSPSRLALCRPTLLPGPTPCSLTPPRQHISLSSPLSARACMLHGAISLSIPFARTCMRAARRQFWLQTSAPFAASYRSAAPYCSALPIASPF